MQGSRSGRVAAVAAEIDGDFRLDPQAVKALLQGGKGKSISWRMLAKISTVACTRQPGRGNHEPTRLDFAHSLSVKRGPCLPPHAPSLFVSPRHQDCNFDWGLPRLASLKKYSLSPDSRERPWGTYFPRDWPYLIHSQVQRPTSFVVPSKGDIFEDQARSLRRQQQC